MWSLITTVLFDLYLVLIALQSNGLFEKTVIPRVIIIVFMIIEGICILVFRYAASFRERNINIKTFLSATIIYLIYIGMYMYIVQLRTEALFEIVFFPLSTIIIYLNYSCIDDKKIFDKIQNIQFYAVFVFAGMFFFAQIQGKAKFDSNINSVYYLVFLIPFLLGNKSKVKKIIGLSIVVFCVFWSTKRTPIIAIAITFSLIYKDINKAGFLKFLKRLCYIVLGIIVLNFIFEKYFSIYMLDRLMKLSTDGGSGRIYLLEKSFNILNDNNLANWLFGHSLSPTASVFSLGAHNDFLEVTYRMGLVGIFIFINLLRSVMYQGKICKKAEDRENWCMLYSSFLLTVVVAMFSQLIYLPTYICLISMAVCFASCSNNLASLPDVEEKLE